MSFTIQLRPAVFEDVQHVHAWYEEQGLGLGDRFIAEFFDSLAILKSNPTIFAAYYREVRHYLLKRFPYGVYFRVEKEEVIVLRVFHCSRNQSSLRQTLSDFSP